MGKEKIVYGKDYAACPNCGSKDILKQEIALTHFHRWVCKRCYKVWDDTPFSYDERKGEGEE